MTLTRNLVAASPFGANGGDSFDDTPLPNVLPAATITKIVIGRYDSNISGVETHYATGNPTTVSRGYMGDTQTIFELEASEYVTMIEGNIVSGRIKSMRFVTNKRILGWVGTMPKDQTKMVWSVADKVPSMLAHRMGLVGFAGAVNGDYVCRLQPVFAEYPCEEMNAKYESVSMQPKDIQLDASAPARDPTLLPTFARRLMAPTVTLYAGRERTVYRASEATLCTLPFFQACLHGNFKEASDRTVSLPDEDAEIVAALLEFLYTGHYTYCYNVNPTANGKGRILGVPSGDLRQALFHLNVFTAAHKYDCASLAAAAMQNLRIVTRELEAGDLLQVCEALYRDGLRLADMTKGEQRAVFTERVTAWAKELCIKQREELVKVTGKWPEFGCDLLEFVTGAGES